MSKEIGHKIWIITLQLKSLHTAPALKKKKVQEIIIQKWKKTPNKPHTHTHTHKQADKTGGGGVLHVHFISYVLIAYIKKHFAVLILKYFRIEKMSNVEIPFSRNFRIQNIYILVSKIRSKNRRTFLKKYKYFIFQWIDMLDLSFCFNVDWLN